ncbi:MAG TPA: hypothetical protein DD619_05180 [Alphaproteobacteria bacterium]|nr:hypothetical protein [Alphaproteobacteria bacterium]
MDDEEIIPPQMLGELKLLFIQHKALRNSKELQLQIIEWAKRLLVESRKEWSDMHTSLLDAVIQTDRRAEAQRKSKERDKKYAPFREYFKKLQQEKYLLAQNSGGKLTANGFVEWFLKNKAQNIEIPYVKQNQKNKLRQLAQQNNREFKKACAG